MRRKATERDAERRTGQVWGDIVIPHLHARLDAVRSERRALEARLRDVRAEEEALATEVSTLKYRKFRSEG